MDPSWIHGGFVKALLTPRLGRRHTDYQLTTVPVTDDAPKRQFMAPPVIQENNLPTKIVGGRKVVVEKSNSVVLVGFRRIKPRNFFDDDSDNEGLGRVTERLPSLSSAVCCQPPPPIAVPPEPTVVVNTAASSSSPALRLDLASPSSSTCSCEVGDDPNTKGSSTSSSSGVDVAANQSDQPTTVSPSSSCGNSLGLALISSSESEQSTLGAAPTTTEEEELAIQRAYCNKAPRIHELMASPITPSTTVPSNTPTSSSGFGRNSRPSLRHRRTSRIQPMPHVFRVILESGETRSFRYDDTSTTVADILIQLQEKLGISVIQHFGLVLRRGVTTPSLSSAAPGLNSTSIIGLALDHDSSATRQAVVLPESMRIRDFVDWCAANEYECCLRIVYPPRQPEDFLLVDTVAFDYLYTQCTNDVIRRGRFDSELGTDRANYLSALHILQFAIASNMTGKLTVKRVDKEFGLDTFVPEWVREERGTSKRQLERQLTDAIQRLQERQRGAGQQNYKLQYVKLLSLLCDYGAQAFPAVLVGFTEERCNLLLGAVCGISYIPLGMSQTKPVFLLRFEHIRCIVIESPPSGTAASSHSPHSTITCSICHIVRDITPIVFLLPRWLKESFLFVLRRYRQLLVPSNSQLTIIEQPLVGTNLLSPTAGALQELIRSHREANDIEAMVEPPNLYSTASSISGYHDNLAYRESPNVRVIPEGFDSEATDSDSDSSENEVDEIGPEAATNFGAEEGHIARVLAGGLQEVPHASVMSKEAIKSISCPNLQLLSCEHLLKPDIYSQLLVAQARDVKHASQELQTIDGFENMPETAILADDDPTLLEMITPPPGFADEEDGAAKEEVKQVEPIVEQELAAEHIQPTEAEVEVEVEVEQAKPPMLVRHSTTEDSGGTGTDISLELVDEESSSNNNSSSQEELAVPRPPTPPRRIQRTQADESSSISPPEKITPSDDQIEQPPTSPAMLDIIVTFNALLRNEVQDDDTNVASQISLPDISPDLDEPKWPWSTDEPPCSVFDAVFEVRARKLNKDCRTVDIATTLNDAERLRVALVKAAKSNQPSTSRPPPLIFDVDLLVRSSDVLVSRCRSVLLAAASANPGETNDLLEMAFEVVVTFAEIGERLLINAASDFVISTFAASLGAYEACLATAHQLKSVSSQIISNDDQSFNELLRRSAVMARSLASFFSALRRSNNE